MDDRNKLPYEVVNKAKKDLRAHLRYGYDKFIPKKKVNHYYGIHPSSAANRNYYCPRKILLYKKALEVGFELPTVKGDPSATQTFQIGHAVHALYQDQFFGPTGKYEGSWKNKKTGEIVMGFMPDLDKPEPWKKWTYVEPRIKITKFNLSGEDIFNTFGSCDGILHRKEGKINKRYVLDIKTSNTRNFLYAKENGPKENYIVQLNIYMYALGIEQGLILYINKDNNDLLEFEIKLDKFLVETILEELTGELNWYGRKSELPPIHFKCKKDTSSTFKQCKFNSFCIGCETIEDAEEYMNEHRNTN